MQEFKTGKHIGNERKSMLNEAFEALKRRLSGLTFALVTNTVAKDENLMSFVYKGITTWNDEPGFEKRRSEISPNEWEKTDRSYHFFFGFAKSKTGDIHFDSKGHNYHREDYTDLGIHTKQRALTPPSRGNWIVGSAINSKKPHFYQWTRCTEQEKLFTEFLLAGKTKFSDDDRRRLNISRHISEGPGYNRLINMAMLLLVRDLDYFLKTRLRHGGDSIDYQVFEIANVYDPELWEEYKGKALEQNLDPVLKYSHLIPKPAPKPIVERRVDASEPDPVGLNTPFADLSLK